MEAPASGAQSMLLLLCFPLIKLPLCSAIKLQNLEEQFISSTLYILFSCLRNYILCGFEAQSAISNGIIQRLRV